MHPEDSLDRLHQAIPHPVARVFCKPRSSVSLTFEMMSHGHVRSPSFSTGPQPEGPPPSMVHQWEEPEAPSQQVKAVDALTSAVILAAGSALHVSLPDGDLLLEPPPACVLRVSLQNHTLVLGHEAGLGSLLQAFGQHGKNTSLSLDLDVLLSATDDQDDSDTEPSSPDTSVFSLWSEDSTLDPSPWVHVPDPDLPEPGPNSPRPPLPPSPSPGLQECPPPHSPSSPWSQAMPVLGPDSIS
ncbi:PREDICTED: proline-rich protein 23B-like [Elephantulus edwardii]|uniref:proline-rich protein 23B-like n=1 Tax=Elephantulus edwardii TaxID=28737 RepID=UPI0003F0A25D|nr:PREDICTED: proline-rich protein 23B-like [Elephantulus edwardii]